MAAKVTPSTPGAPSLFLASAYAARSVSNLQTWTYKPQKRQDVSAFALTYSLRLRSCLASLDLACPGDHGPDVSATLTTVAFDHSRSRWLGISDLIAEPEGPSFISSTVAQRRVDRRCS